MGYIGTPIDTRNQFQSLVGKRFSGDGSTTAFTLDVAPSSTLDIEVFVGNVRQDPNSAYTVSGTTLTFTGAPPSGTNNIYVVHQAKSVGTITPGANSVGVTELNLSDGSSGQFIKTDGSGTLSFASVASLAGIDDQTSSNDDQLTITDTAVVINEDSDDLDFRVEGNGEANLLYIDAGEDKIYSGISSKSVHAAGYEPHIQIEGTGDNKNSLSLTQNSNNNGAPAIIMCKTRGTSVGSTTIVQDDDYLGNIIFGGADGNDRQTYGAHIIARVEGTPGENDMPTELKFGTTSDSASSPSDRLIIDSSGRVNINTASAITTEGVLQVSGNSSQNLSAFRVATNGQYGLRFFNSSTQAVGYIAINASSTTYSTSSDYRLKENAVAISDGITRLKTLKPYRFNFKTEPDKKVDGFFAHEVTAVPEAINGTKDAMAVETRYTADDVETQGDNPSKKVGDAKTYSTTEIDPQGIDQSKLVPLLTAALQEAVTKIETLEAKVKALEEA